VDAEARQDQVRTIARQLRRAQKRKSEAHLRGQQNLSNFLVLHHSQLYESTSVLQIVDLCVQAAYKAHARHLRIERAYMAMQQYKIALGSAVMLGLNTAPQFNMPVSTQLDAITLASEFIQEHNKSSTKKGGVARVWRNLGYFPNEDGGFDP